MASIKDVAKLAQVSVGSVSKYLNGGKLKEKTTIAIEQAIKDLNYEKNTYATGLRDQPNAYDRFDYSDYLASFF